MPRDCWRTLLAVVVLVVMASGCRLDVEVATTLSPDGSGSVVVTVQPDAELLARVPTLFDEVRFDDATAAGWTVDGPTSEGVLTISKPFRTPAEGTRVLQELNGSNGPLREVTLGQERGFARVTSSFAGTVQLEGGLAAFADAALVQTLGGVPLADVVTVPLQDGLRLTVTAVLPGRVTATDGDEAEPASTAVDATEAVSTVRWAPSLAPGAVTVMSATAELVDGGARAARRNALAGWGALAVYLALVAVAGVLLSRRYSSRHRRDR